MKKKIFFVEGLRNRTAAQLYEYLWYIISDKKEFVGFFICPADESVRWPLKSQPPNVKKIWSNNHYVRKLDKFFKANNPSIIHIFFERRDFGALNFTVKFPFLLFLLKSRGAKIVLTLNNPFIFREQSKWRLVDIPLKIPKFVIKIFVKLFVKTVCSLSHKVVVETPLTKSGLTDYYGVNGDKIEVIFNAVPVDKPPINQEKKEKLLARFSGKKLILIVL